MKTGNSLTKFIFCLIVLVGIDYLPTYAQKQKTKVTIIKESYDENGNKTVQTIIKEGAEADAIDLDNLGKSNNGQGLQWFNFNSDSLPLGNQFFDYSFKNPESLRSLMDSLGLGNFNFFDQDNFGLFGDDGFNSSFELSRPKLGIRISKLETQAGVVINEVMPGTPAEKAGLKVGDIIVSIDQNKVDAPEDLVNHIESLDFEDTVALDIIREGEYLEIEAQLSEIKPKKELEIRKL